jgi:ribonuclease VapC
VSGAVLDASALVALLGREEGAEVVEGFLAGSAISTVNWSEVIQIAASLELPTEGRRAQIEALGVALVPFSPQQAEIAADLAPRTAAAGLSLADRACLATALDLGAEVVTGDRVWAELDLDLSLHLIR